MIYIPKRVDPYVNGLAESIPDNCCSAPWAARQECCVTDGADWHQESERQQERRNIITIADKTGVWYMEILSGHQYVAIKFPDDKYAVFPNTFFLGSVDFDDTENVIASKEFRM